MKEKSAKSAFRQSKDRRTVDFRTCDIPKVQRNWLESIDDPLLVENLYFGSAHISEESFASVSQLSNLRVLVIRSRHFNNSWAGYLVELKKLEELDLSNCRISDDSIVSLCELPRLKILRLWGTRITKLGSMHLHKVLGKNLKVIGVKA